MNFLRKFKAWFFYQDIEAEIRASHARCIAHLDGMIATTRMLLNEQEYTFSRPVASLSERQSRTGLPPPYLSGSPHHGVELQ